MLPKIIRQSGISSEALVIDDTVWPQIVRPLGYDAGMRTLERTIQGIVRRVAKDMVEGKIQTFKVTTENVKQFLQ